MKRLWLQIAFYLSFALFGCVAFGLNISCGLIVCLPGKKKLEKPARKLIEQLFRFWTFWLKTTGLLRLQVSENVLRLRDVDEVIFISNHPNLMDVCFLLPFLPTPVCIYKGKLRRNRFLNGSAALAGYISNDKGVGTVFRAVDVLREGYSLLLFPEGTRTVTEPINPFNSSFALISKRSEKKIVPLVIHTDAVILKKGHFFKREGLPISFSIDALEPLAPCTDENATDYSRRVRGLYCNALTGGNTP